MPFSKYKNFKTHAVFLEKGNVRQNSFTASRPIVSFFAPPDRESSEAFADYISSLKAFPAIKVLSLDGLSAKIEAKLGAPHSSIASIAVATERETDVNRIEVALKTWTLFPYIIPVSTIYSNFRYFAEPRFLTILCVSGEVRTSSYSGAEPSDLSCEPQLISITRGPDHTWPFRIAGAESQGFPESPFFFTSFALANLYYALLILFISGSFFVRMISYAFSTPYLESASKPFTLLSVVLFPIIVLITALLRLI